MKNLLLLSVIVLFGSEVFSQTEDISGRREGLYVDPRWEPAPKEKKLTKREKELLFPSKEIQAEFKPTLRLSGAKLARLFPNEKYQKAVGLQGAKAYYSFHRRTSLNEITNIDSSIFIEKGKFIAVLAGADLGFMINLGDIKLEDVTSNRPDLKFLLEYKYSASESEVRREKLQLLQKGKDANGFRYKREAVAQLNETYALRYVSFGSFDHAVIFRTLRELDDGSYIIAWKFLKKYSIPRLKR